MANTQSVRNLTPRETEMAHIHLRFHISALRSLGINDGFPNDFLILSIQNGYYKLMGISSKLPENSE